MKNKIEQGKTVLGIELGSTRIKAVLIDEKGTPVASGSHSWENLYEDGIWTYSEEMIWNGLQDAYTDLRENVYKEYGVLLKKVRSIGISAMMHGYMAFDSDGRLLVPFRTWRNTITGEAADKLTKDFGFNIPQRWSISHLYQAILNNEEHVKDIAHLTTLAGYIHWKLTGEIVLGVGDASGMFPIDSRKCDYNESYIGKFNEMIADRSYSWNLRGILPRVLKAGDKAGCLTKQGASLLDKSGLLHEGVPMCPPEGDAGTGMTATNSVAVRTGNVSAGTSIFAMIVMEKALKGVHEEIDVVTTPEGNDVAMVHCNNCTSDINAWASLFKEFIEKTGGSIDTDKLYNTLFSVALSGNPDCGGLMGFNYFSGEPVTGFTEGRPLFMRKVNADFTLGNFMRLHLYSAVSTLKYGLDILFGEENVKFDKLYGHGGFFKTKEVGQRIMSAAVGGPVTVMETAGEGGAWGIALLALYLLDKKDMSLGEFLDNVIFAGEKGETVMADKAEIEGFDTFMKNFAKAFDAERSAIDCI